MPTPAITVENLSKAYRIGLKEEIPDTFTSAATSWLRSPFRNLGRLRSLNTFRQTGDADDIVWALKDVSFEVNEGEVVGVIGRNGAGKSTLLKILSRITEPTHGEARIHGRVSSLLEVGTGFHPELTGRENVYMNATILGMTKREIDRRFDAIVDFSGVEKFLDTPVKRYSSGMQVRLAFAVAAHLDPEILIVDEVLAVGDAEFQKKCLGKMQDVAGSGRTVLFVSHNMAAVRALCSRGILLEGGRLTFDDEAGEVVNHYRLGAAGHQHHVEWSPDAAPGSAELSLIEASVEPLTGEEVHTASGFAIVLRVLCREPLPNLDTTIELRTLDDTIVVHDGWGFTSTQACDAGFYETRVEFPPHLLNRGRYKLNLIFGQNKRYLVARIDDVLVFEIGHEASRHLIAKPGVIAPQLEFSSQFLGNLDSRELTQPA